MPAVTDPWEAPERYASGTTQFAPFTMIRTCGPSAHGDVAEIQTACTEARARLPQSLQFFAGNSEMPELP